LKVGGTRPKKRRVCVDAFLSLFSERALAPRADSVSPRSQYLERLFVKEDVYEECN